MSYRIVTDSCCDFPEGMIPKLDITSVSLSLHFREQTLEEVTDEQLKEMYQALRAGEMATTSAVNPEGWANAMEPALASGQDVLVLAFSSGLSTTYQSAVIAAQELSEKYPERKIEHCKSI